MYVIFWWDVVQWLWTFDLPKTFVLEGENVFGSTMKGNLVSCPPLSRHPCPYFLPPPRLCALLISQIAEVCRSLDGTPSVLNIQRATSDLAIAKLVRPVNIPYGHRPIKWNRLPSTPAPIYLLGSNLIGEEETNLDNVDEVQKVVVGICSGLSYLRDVFVTRRSLQYAQSPAIIWRCRDPTIQGFSGGLLVRPGDAIGQGEHSYHVVGFQSHEVSRSTTVQAERFHWKIALQPPLELTRDFWASAPGETCRELDLRVERDALLSEYVPSFSPSDSVVWRLGRWRSLEAVLSKPMNSIRGPSVADGCCCVAIRMV